MSKKGKTEYVSFKSVSLPVSPHVKHGVDCYRFAYPDESKKGGWGYGVRKTKQLAREAAHCKAVEIMRGLLDLSALSQDQAKLCRDFLDLNPTQADIRALKALRARSNLDIKTALERFTKFKLKEAGQKTQHLKSQNTYLERLVEFTENGALAEIKAEEIEAWLANMEEDLKIKSINEHRASAVALWIWAEKQEIIESRGKFNEAQKTTRRKDLEKKPVETYSPDEMRTLIANVRPQFLPWLVIVAFSGLRSGELRRYQKEPLTWSAIKLDQLVIDCPAKISKNRKRKLVPINDTLAKWLESFGEQEPDEPIVKLAPNYRETTRLGKLIKGGWKHNGVRHSFGSHLVAHTQDVARIAFEMDNSEAVIKKHYLEAKTKEEAADYLSITPDSIGTKSGLTT